MVDLRRERKPHVMMIQCWPPAGMFVEVYVSHLIRHQWDAGTWGGGHASDVDMEGDGCVVF